MDTRFQTDRRVPFSRVARFVGAAVLTGAIVSLGGCDSILAGLGVGEPYLVLKGQDSAGAVIELEKRGDVFTKARVADAILGTAEAPIDSAPNGEISFAIEFPAGATVSYVGVIENEGTSFDLSIGGTWTQQAAGIFGTDEGTWSAASASNLPRK